MHIHFIAVGGSVMHNLAITLHKKGFKVTGSDDEIFEPAKNRLSKYKLLPLSTGWDPSKITPGVDAVILGMHAGSDNPELIKARELGIKIYSFPEYLYEQTKNKKRIVIAGSHGKTTITSMILHALKYYDYKFDYMVGSVIQGFDTMTGLNDNNDIAIFEGDEYLSSRIDPRPKFHLYKPHIGLISGIAWDHMNVFPTFEDYLEQFRIFINHVSDSLIFFEKDRYLIEMAGKHKERLSLYPYNTLPHTYKGNNLMIKYKSTEIPLNIFGQHNLQNLAGAMQVCKLLGLNSEQFLHAMQTFKGAARRQEHLAGNDEHNVYLDFAHAPSKVKATVEAFRQHFPDKVIIACLELHTFSSLNSIFLPQYRDSMRLADAAIVFFDPEVVKHKKLPGITSDQIISAFSHKNLTIINNRDDLELGILKLKRNNSLLLIMTSGNFSGINIHTLAKRYLID